jgi:hypothetical protein
MQYKFLLSNERNPIDDLVKNLQDLTNSLSEDGFKVSYSPEKNPALKIPERMIVEGKEDPMDYIIASELPYELIGVIE